MKQIEDRKAKDKHQEWYRQIFHIEDKFLLELSVSCSYEEWESMSVEDRKKVNGYIVYIDYENDIDFQDTRSNMSAEDEANFAQAVSMLVRAESEPHLKLPEDVILSFKKILATGYILALEGSFDGINDIVAEAKAYLEERNREQSRYLYLKFGTIITLVASIIGLILYVFAYKDKWIYGILFGILGAYISIWTRYGRGKKRVLASDNLHYFEGMSRIFVGVIFGIIAMLLTRSGLLLTDVATSNELVCYSLISFVASFSERFIPSIIEHIVNQNVKEHET